MIVGTVFGNEGWLRLTVVGSRGQREQIEAVLDTGYTASLTLPPSLIAALGLRWQYSDRVVLADGSECFFRVYKGTVMWDGRARPIFVDAAESIPLIGMSLLRGHELKMQVRNGGRLTIERLSRR